MKYTFNNFVTIDRRESGFRIMRNDVQNVSCSKHSMPGDKESDDSVVNTAVEGRKLSPINNVVAVNDFFIIKLNNATKVFSLVARRRFFFVKLKNVHYATLRSLNRLRTACAPHPITTANCRKRSFFVTI